MLIIQQRIITTNIQKMIDYIKIEIANTDLIESISRNPLLIFDKVTEKANKKTGELFHINYYFYKNLKFITTISSNNVPNKMYISGSLHYYHNNGLHNASDFTYIQFLGVVNDLKEKFNINSNDCCLRALEYGINFVPGKYQTNKILQNTFYHQRKKVTEPIGKPYRQFGDIRQHEYILKFYDKAFQFPGSAPGELMRFEIRYSRMRELRKIGISNLSDLLNIENHLKLHNILLKRFNELLIFDFTIRPKTLSSSKRQIVSQYANINFWEDLLSNTKTGQLSRKNFTYHKNQLKKHILNNSEQVQNTLLQIIDNKGINLLNLSKYNPKKRTKRIPYPHSESDKFCIPFPPLVIRWKQFRERHNLITKI